MLIYTVLTTYQQNSKCSAQVRLTLLCHVHIFARTTVYTFSSTIVDPVSVCEASIWPFLPLLQLDDQLFYSMYLVKATNTAHLYADNNIHTYTSSSHLELWLGSIIKNRTRQMNTLHYPPTLCHSCHKWLTCCFPELCDAHYALCILVHIVFTTFSRKCEVTPHFAALVWYFYCMHWFSKSWVLLQSGLIKPLFIVHVWWKWRAGSIIFNQNCTGEFEVGVTSAYTELVLRKGKHSIVQQKL